MILTKIILIACSALLLILFTTGCRSTVDERIEQTRQDVDKVTQSHNTPTHAELEAAYDPCDIDDAPMRELEECEQKALERSDAELTALYNQILPGQKPKAAETLKLAQEAWTKYRETNCQAEFERLDGDPQQRARNFFCRRALTELRIGELERIYQLVPQENRNDQ